MDKAKGEKSQRQKFIDLAREVDADEDEKAFDEKLRRIARKSRPTPRTERPEDG